MIAKPYEYGTCKAESPSFITYPLEESKLFMRLNQIKKQKKHGYWNLYNEKYGEVMTHGTQLTLNSKSDNSSHNNTWTWKEQNGKLKQVTENDSIAKGRKGWKFILKW